MESLPAVVAVLAIAAHFHPAAAAELLALADTCSSSATS